MIFSVWLVSTWFLVDRVALIATSGCFWFALDVLVVTPFLDPPTKIKIYSRKKLEK
jgi:hypothetical protein